MPRPKSANPKIPKHIPIDPELCAKTELILFSDVEGRVPYGAWTNLVEHLLRKHFQHLERKEALEAELSRLAQVSAQGDLESAHVEADKLLTAELTALGYDVSAFTTMGKHYA